MIPDHHHERRRPTTAELGLDVTVGIAAITAPDGYIVAVSDQQITYYDEFPALERGARKIVQIAPDKSWFCAFSASDIAAVPPLLGEITRRLREIYSEDMDAATVMRETTEIYTQRRYQEFAQRHLKAIGYESVAKFRKDGFSELGRDEHHSHMKALYEFNLGVELLVFGHSKRSKPRIFTITNPGKCTHWNWQGYAAVGSGAYLAQGALRQRPMSFDIEDAIYRLLEAKFVSEGGYVGRTTTLLALSPEGESWEMRESEINQIKDIWQSKQKEPTPDDALGVIGKTSVLRHLTKDGER